MQCTVKDCHQAAIITTPVPLCEQDTLSVLAAYAAHRVDSLEPKPDPLMGAIRADFARLIKAGEAPSIQQIRKTYRIGQGRALALHRALVAALASENKDVRGAVAKRRQIEEATFEAAVVLSTGSAPTRREFAAQYGRSETWGRERYADAERLLAEDADYAARVLAEAEQRAAGDRHGKDEQVPA